MLTTVKFVPNAQRVPRPYPNRTISRTLGKIATINQNWTGPLPEPYDLWTVKIVSEVYHGIKRGCFIVDPIEHRSPDELTHLPVTMIDLEMRDGILFVRPKKDLHHLWILPKTHRKSLAQTYNAYAVVINLGGTYWF